MKMLTLPRTCQHTCTYRAETAPTGATRTKHDTEGYLVTSSNVQQALERVVDAYSFGMSTTYVKLVFSTGFK